MQNYVILARLRENGDSQSSALRTPSQIVSDSVSKAGGKIVSAHATLGFYDLCIVASFPDQPSAFRASTTLKTQHNWITETMAAEPLANFDSIYSEIQKETSLPSRR